MTTPAPIVPLPVRTVAGEGLPFLLPDGPLTVTVPEGGEGNATAWFAEVAARVHGIDVVVSAAPGGHVEVVLGDPVALGLDAVTEATGVDPRPDPADERHRLTVGAAGVRVEAASDAGAFRALTTLLQLVTRVDGRLTVDAVVVEDGPAFLWRGLSLDVVRHFFTVEEVCRVVDLLAWLKLDVLHLHLTDTQGWRFEVASRPRLTGPDGSADFYTRADLARIVEHAANRHVVVVPEVDLPGHVAAAVAAYPELTGGEEPAHPLVAYLDADEPAALAFTRDVLGALADAAPGPFVHMGADEPFGMPVEAYERFVKVAYEILRGAGKRVVAWQEGVRADCLGADDVLQYWIGPDNTFDAVQVKTAVPEPMHGVVDAAAAMFALAPGDVPAAAALGVPVLVSSNTSLYLDRPYALEAGTAEAEERRGRVGFPAYEPRTPEQSFDWHPSTLREVVVPGASVVGVEAAVWGETIESFDDLAFLLLPRLAGVAEKAWTAQVTLWSEHAARVEQHRPAWAALGFGAAYLARDEEGQAGSGVPQNAPRSPTLAK